MTIFKKAIIIGVVIGVGIIVALQKWGLLFYGVIFLCPLMHLFMHNGHAGHDRNNSHGNHKNQSDHDKDNNSNSSHRGCH